MLRVLLVLLLLVPAAAAAELRITWEPPATVPPGVVISGYHVLGCLVPGTSTTCPPVDLPTGAVGPTVRTWVDTAVVGGGRYCYAAVTLASGAKQPRSAPSSPVVCAVAPFDLSEAPLPPQNVRATVPALAP